MLAGGSWGTKFTGARPSKHPQIQAFIPHAGQGSASRQAGAGAGAGAGSGNSCRGSVTKSDMAPCKSRGRELGVVGLEGAALTDGDGVKVDGVDTSH